MPTTDEISPAKMPCAFIGHGNPMHAIADNIITQSWRDWAAQTPRPQAILVISAHWMTTGTQITANAHPPTIHDFYGFPAALSQVQYPAAGSQSLIERVSALLPALELSDQWGLDHGTWSFLRHMYPNADIPVAQLSLNSHLSSLQHYQLGQKLAPLREQGILVIGSGNIVHNLPQVNFSPNASPQPWAIAFDAYIQNALIAGNHEAIIHYAAHEWAYLAHPTEEHFLPLLYLLGMSDAASDKVSFFNQTIELATMSMRSVVFAS